MQKQSRLLPFQAGLLLFSATLSIGQMRPVGAHPYQENSVESYRQEQAKWRDVIRRDPKNPEAYLQLAASLSSEAAEGYWCETYAIAAYRQAITAVPPNAEIHFQLAGSLLSDPVNCDEYSPTEIAARHKEALIHLRKAIAIDSTKDDYYMTLGDALKNQGQSDAAMAAYKAAISLPFKPDQRSDSLANKSMRYLLIGDYLREQVVDLEAAAAYRKALAIAPDNPTLQKTFEGSRATLKN